MLDIEPPEVPRKPVLKKEGFFAKLFSKKPEPVITKPEPLSEINLDTELEKLPELPVLELTPEQPSKKFGKSKGKGLKKKIEKLDLRKSFDWSNQITEQELMIKDSIRNNDQVNKLMAAADNHVDNTMENVSQNASLPEQLPEVNLESVDIPELNTPLSINPKEKSLFTTIDKNHERLRAKLSKSLSSEKYTKKEFRELLRQYDKKIERKIEFKEQELSKRRDKIEKMHKSLIKKQKEVNEFYRNLKDLEKKLKNKEDKLDNIINSHVEKQLAKRLNKDRLLLRKELRNTSLLNNKLKKQLDIIERERTEFESKKEKILKELKDKMNYMQTTYDNKLKQLSDERNDFEKKRASAIELLNKGDAVHKDLEQLQNLKDSMEQKRNYVDKMFTEDKELQKAISNAELRLGKKREQLDNMIFSKYIEWKLKQPDSSEDVTKLFTNPKIDGLKKLIRECRKLIARDDIHQAKASYNNVKSLFESMESKDKEMFYNIVRELYNDIQLAAMQADY